MAHTWKLAIGLGFLGAALAAGCTVKEGDGDDDGGAAGESGSGGTGGTTGGSSGKGGTAGSSAGKGGSSGAAGKGGSAGSGTAGTGGSTGGSAGTGGAAVGGTTSDGGMAGAGDTGGTDTMATCDPASGELDSTPYPNCDADPSDDPCQVCIQESCCEESKKCYGTDPNNVCGWGGPANGDMNEIGCFQKCLFDKTAANEDTCTAEDADTCASECATTMCFEGMDEFALIGNATNELASCMMENCADSCFGAETCD